MRNMKNLARLLMMGALFENSMGPYPVVGGRGDNQITPEEISPERKKVIPKGCREYFFNAGGKFEYTNWHDTVFSCIASSEKKANEKFIKWHNAQ